MKLLEAFMGKQGTASFGKKIKEHFNASLEAVYAKALGAGAALALALCTVLFFAGTGAELLLLAFPVALVLPLVAVVFYYSYRLEKRNQRLEEETPMALLQASVFPDSMPVSEMIGFLAGKENGLAGKEFKKAEKEIKKGSSVLEALERLKKRNNCGAIDGLAGILEIAYESGAGMGESFRELAEEMLEMRAIRAEKRAAMAIQRVTLLMGSLFVVPFILGVLTGMVFGLDFEGIEIAGFSDSMQRQELLELAPLANNVYIIEYALIASLFLAWLEGRPKKAVVFFAVIAPVSVSVFFFSQSLGL